MTIGLQQGSIDTRLHQHTPPMPGAAGLRKRKEFLAARDQESRLTRAEIVIFPIDPDKKIPLKHKGEFEVRLNAWPVSTMG